MPALPESTLESIAVANAKSVAEQPATLANLQLGNLGQNTNQSQQNSVSMQHTVNNIQATILGKVANMLTTVGPLEAVSVQEILTGNATAQGLAEIKATEKERVETDRRRGG